MLTSSNTYEEISKIIGTGGVSAELLTTNKIELLKDLYNTHSQHKKWRKLIMDLISELLSEYMCTQEESNKMIEMYELLAGNDIKKLSKVIKHVIQPIEVATDLLIYSPRCGKSAEYAIVKKKSLRFVNYIYGMSKICEMFSEDELDKIIKFIFGKTDMTAFIITILTESPNKKENYTDPQKEMWGMFSLYVLRYMNNMEKNELWEMLLNYASLVWEYKRSQRLSSIKDSITVREFGRLVSVIDELCVYDETLLYIL